MDNEIDIIGSRLKMHWSSQGINLNPPASETALTRFESRYTVSLPNDFCDYLLHVNGMAPEATDNELIRFWSIEEIKPLSEETPQYAAESYLVNATGFFVFADYSMWAHAYAIRLSSGPLEPNSIVVIGANKPILIADSFLSFVQSYLAGRALEHQKTD